MSCANGSSMLNKSCSARQLTDGRPFGSSKGMKQAGFRTSPCKSSVAAGARFASRSSSSHRPRRRVQAVAPAPLSFKPGVPTPDARSITPQHIALVCGSLDASLSFYAGMLGLPLNGARPDTKLPYRGAWLVMGPEMLHLLELPNPQKNSHQRVLSIVVPDLAAIEHRLCSHGISYTRSDVGDGAALLLRDPDNHCVALTEGAARP